MRIAPCAAGFALERYGRGRENVLVRCPDAGGWRMFVPLTADSAGAQQAAAAVSRGEVVTVSVKGRGFSLSRQGEALEGGAVGDWIRVRPTDKRSGEPMRAQILRPGVVGMELP